MLSKGERLMLYWCEGDKTLKACMVSVTCAEPSMLRFFIGWLCEYYKADGNRIGLPVLMHQNALNTLGTASIIAIENMTV